MLPYNCIRVIQIEGTARCNAACPMCIRYDQNGAQYPFLTGAHKPEITGASKLAFWQTKIPPDVLAGLTTINFCGNYGDPALMREIEGILGHFRAAAPECRIVMETNGGGASSSMWAMLGSILKGSPHEVVFNIDGLEDTLAVYRRGVSFTNVLKHANAFISNGGKATWSFLVFRHNEHQIDHARALSKALGFHKFQMRLTDRFFGNDGSVHFAISGLEPPTKGEYRYSRAVNGEEFVRLARSCKVECPAQKGGRIYIDYCGRVFPCCFLAPVEGPDVERLGTVEVTKLLQAMPNANSLHQHTLREILEGPFFKELERLLAVPAERPLACGAVCGLGNFKITKE